MGNEFPKIDPEVPNIPRQDIPRQGDEILFGVAPPKVTGDFSDEVSDPELDGSTEFNKPEREITVAGIAGAGMLALVNEDEPDNPIVSNWLQRSVERASRISGFLGKGTKLPGKILRTIRDNPLLFGAAAVSSWVFEIGPWNETLRLDIGFGVFQRTQSPIQTGLVIGLATVPIEMIPATLVAWGLSREDMPGRKAMKWMHEKLGAGSDGADNTKKGQKTEKMQDTSLALAVGAAAVMAKRALTKKTEFSEEIKEATKLSLAIAVFSGAVGWATTYGMLNAEGTWFESAADFLEKNGTNAKFWLAVFGAIHLASALGKLTSNRKKPNGDEEHQDNLSPNIVEVDGWQQVPAWELEDDEKLN